MLLTLFSLQASAENVRAMVAVDLDGVPFRISRFIGGGVSGKVYAIESTVLSADQRAIKYFVPSSQIRDVNYFLSVVIDGNSKVMSIDPDGSKFLFSPRLYKIPNDPKQRPPNAVSDYAVVTRLAYSDLHRQINLDKQSPAQFRVNLARKVLDQIIPELVHLNEAGLVHGDIKPGNILMTQDGRFGLADFDSTSESGNRVKFISKGYIAPENSDGKPISTASDLYSLASTVYEILHPQRLRDPKTKAPFKFTPEQLNDVLNEIEREIYIGSLEERNSFQKVKEFLNAASKEDKATRLNDFAKTEYGKKFKIGLLAGQSSQMNIQSKMSYVVKKVLSSRNTQAILFYFMKYSDQLIPAMQAAHTLGVDVPSKKPLLISFLKNGRPQSAIQMEYLRKYLGVCHCLDDDIARELFKRFIGPINSESLTPSWVYELVGRFPNIITENGSWLEDRKKQNFSETEKSKLLKLDRLTNLPQLEAETLPAEVFHRERSCRVFYGVAN